MTSGNCLSATISSTPITVTPVKRHLGMPADVVPVSMLLTVDRHQLVLQVLHCGRQMVLHYGRQMVLTSLPACLPAVNL